MLSGVKTAVNPMLGATVELRSIMPVKEFWLVIVTGNDPDCPRGRLIMEGALIVNSTTETFRITSCLNPPIVPVIVTV